MYDFKRINISNGVSKIHELSIGKIERTESAYDLVFSTLSFSCNGIAIKAGDSSIAFPATEKKLGTKPTKELIVTIEEPFVGTGFLTSPGGEYLSLIHI